MTRLKRKSSISFRWWINYFAALSLEGYVFLQLQMDSSDLKEGQSYVLLSLVANLLLAYLTSWLFWIILEWRDQKHTKHFYRAHLEEIFEHYVAFAHVLTFLDIRTEDEPWSSRDIARLSRYIVNEYRRKHTGMGGEVLLPVLSNTISVQKLSLDRNVTRMKERRNTDDELFRLLDLLTYSFYNVPDFNKGNNVDLSAEKQATAIQYWFVRVHLLERYCIERGVIKPNLLTKMSRKLWEPPLDKESSDIDKLMKTALANNKERLSLAATIKKAEAKGELVQVESA